MVLPSTVKVQSRLGWIVHHSKLSPRGARLSPKPEGAARMLTLEHYVASMSKPELSTR
jgi:hypothetical protein